MVRSVSSRSRLVFGQCWFYVSIALIAGCGSPMSPEEAAAISRVQKLGASILFRDGGYAVDFSRTKVQDADLVQLRDIPSLKSLSLAETPITDEGLRHLEQLPNLVSIDVTRAKVSLDGIDRLKKALPNATVKY